MKIYLTDKHKINMYSLPKNIEDSFLINYITENGLEENINIIAENGKWKIESNPETSFYKNGQAVTSEILEHNSIFQIKFSDVENYLTFYCFETPVQYFSYDVRNQDKIIIGRGASSNIIYDNPYISPESIEIKKESTYWLLNILNPDQEVYINNYMITKKVLHLGDVIFINGLKIIWLDEYIKINVPKDKLSITFKKYEKTPTNGNSFTEITDTERASVLYNDNQIFFHTPRLKETIKEKEISIQLPPKNAETNRAPIFLQLGGSIMMGLSSSISGVIAVFSIINGKATLLSSITEITVCIGMLFGSIFFPVLLDRYQKRVEKKLENKRQTKYKEYLKSKEEEINRIMVKEKEILLENNYNIKEIQTNLVNRNNKIWNREIRDLDFLSIRLGIGNIKPNLTIKASLEEFSLDDDNLKKEVEELVNKKLILENVPITASLIEDKILPVIISDTYPKRKQYIDSLMLQIISYYSGVDLKIAIITSEDRKEDWEYIKYLPHCSSNDKTEHYFATTEDEIKQLTSTLEKKRKERADFYNNNADSDEEKKSKIQEDDNYKYKNFDTYYLIITDNFISAKKYEFLEKIIETDENLGFSILMFENNMKNLPSRCNHFVDIEENVCGFYSKDLSEENQKTFTPEFQNDNNNPEYSQILANIPIIGENMANTLPTSLNFLEMYKVGKIEQLNIMNRWMKNDPTQSLHAPIGVQTDGKLFELDLHEKFHGPHGLIAGATGSGKSEFIITFILSMAVNYHPYEVQFVLIDYKGGGLAGAFENKETGIKLPHLAGVITNLDTAEMNRTLVSIKSELKRRQRIFNEARDKLGESTVDIYKYQKFYREGKVQQPISHLFIISDEFAELKDQQPEFMDELVSIARIGRSLGVHLILATQKPSGVVDDQIWSNSRFKISLKVQTQEDSMEMLKRPEAASIKETGRFYLQVGVNEIFEIGQSAWSGAKYIPKERIIKSYDDDIEFIDNNGNYIKRINNTIKAENQVDYGDQLTNLVKILHDIATRNSIKVKSLWLPSINPIIYISDLISKYNYKSEPYTYNILIGEYDDPENQYQDKLTIDLKNSGNILIYGISGSGKENLLSTIVYTSCIYHTTNEINFYILDFGAEIFGNFSKFPQVGDVVTSADKEKVRNQFDKINREINRRKELFKDYGGNFDSYLKQSNEKLPLIVTIINNYESFNENNMDLDDILTTQLRESSKYGIIFITTSVSTNAVRMSVAQLYNTKIMLQVSDPFEYVYQLDANKSLTPSKYFGRGLIKLSNGTFEFQTAYIYLKDKINDAIKNVAAKLEETKMKNAPQIPRIPKEITAETMLSEITDIDSVPIGFNIDTSEVSRFNFIKNKISFISGTQINTEPQFLLDLIKIISNIPSVELKVIDLADNMAECGIEECYNDEFTSVISSIKTSEEETKQKIIYIITGIGYIYDRVLDEGIADLFSIFSGKYNLPNSYFILADNAVSIRKLEQEEWYINCNKNNGIWIGQNFADQKIFNTNKVRDYDTLEDYLGLAYVINDGNYEVIKSVGSKETRGW